MGMTLSAPFATINDLNSRFESYLVRSISFGSNDVKSYGSGKMIIEGSLSFKGTELETKISLTSPFLKDGAMVRLPSYKSKDIPSKMTEKNNSTPMEESGNQRYEAAVKLQKTYKSFRTRRQLADCAVLVEQRWWKLLDYAELKRSSVSFFDIERPETAVSRWSRARTRAAKVGKGLSKDEKARKLALQHWLEAIDPRHRYGHNLQFYYVKWLQCESKQPFFYWLDIGEGKETNLDKCPRSKLQLQCIKYLGPREREEFEVSIDDGKLIYKQSGKLVDTRGGNEDSKWIFVLSVSKMLYIGQKKKGAFQHSSFLAGGATLSAGRLSVEDGILKAVWPHSGHYLPTEENFEEFIIFLTHHNVDLSVVQKAPTGEDEVTFIRKESTHVRNSISGPDFCRSSEIRNSQSFDGGKTDSCTNFNVDTQNFRTPSKWSTRLQAKIALIQIPKRENMSDLFKKKEEKQSIQSAHAQTQVDGYETAEEYLSDTEFSVSKENLFDEDQEEEYEEPIPKEKIMKRINSHKGMKSYQLARQLSCKWTTGAGPRIGCVRDYPSELQFRALEDVNLSPRSAHSSPRKFSLLSPKVSSSSTANLCRETSIGLSPLAL